ncbi:hypothetical protein HYZ99_00365 [Candidatus Peregrinibacteria bacterium]|nr:hypothetical protein [Candidatus Peregrinibacteria bacterium]
MSLDSDTPTITYNPEHADFLEQQRQKAAEEQSLSEDVFEQFRHLCHARLVETLREDGFVDYTAMHIRCYCEIGTDPEAKQELDFSNPRINDLLHHVFWKAWELVSQENADGMGKTEILPRPKKILERLRPLIPGFVISLANNLYGRIGRNGTSQTHVNRRPRSVRHSRQSRP